MIGDHTRVDSSGGAVILAPVKTSGGDFIGRDQVNHYLNQYHVKVNVLRTSPKNERQRSLKQAQPNPYLPARPFQEFENPLFSGRREEIEHLLTQINDEHTQTSVVYGAPNMGKTSLLLSGVIPEIEAESMLVIKLRDYSYPIPFIRAGLIGRAQQLGLSVGENPNLAELAELVNSKSDRILLVLDQFERFFLPGLAQEESEALMQELSEITSSRNAEQFHILVGIRSEFQAEFDRMWGKILPDLRKDSVYLGSLFWSQARRAIEHPLDVLDFPASFTDDIVNQRLLPDLDALYNLENQRILPGDLQIICHGLYQAARGQRPHHINTDLYLEISDKKGADRLLDLHFERMLARVPQQHQLIAEHVFKTMLASETQNWFRSQELIRNGYQVEEIEMALNAMTDAKLLTWHLEEMLPSYGFANYSVQREAERLYGRAAYKAHQARNELEYVYRAWVAYNAWAKPDQLAYIQENFQKQTSSPEKALLTLRSAIRSEIPVNFWLEHVEDENIVWFVKQLENQVNIPEGDRARLTQVDSARLLLGLYDDEMPPHPGDAAFGQLTWGAVAHPDEDCRETSVLVLGSAFKQDAFERLKEGVIAGKYSKSRLTELRGMLADVGSTFDQEIQKLNIFERGSIWWWRFRRRFSRDAQDLGIFFLGGALGVGLALGLLRTVLAIIVIERPGAMFYNYFPMGFVTGGLLALGLLLVNTLQLKPLTEEIIGKPGWPKILLGAFGFMTGHLLLNFLFDDALYLRGSYAYMMAFLAGLTLSISVCDQPKRDSRMAVREWLKRSAFVMVVFAGIQISFILLSNWGTGLVFIWTGDTYQSLLDERLTKWGIEGIWQVDYWYHIVGIIDAALAGLVMFVGLVVGLARSNQLYVKLHGRK